MRLLENALADLVVNCVVAAIGQMSQNYNKNKNTFNEK